MLVAAILLASGAIYHYFFLKAAREGWPVVSQLVKLVVHDESAQRDKILRENLDAMALKVGDMQARMIKIEAMGDPRVGHGRPQARGPVGPDARQGRRRRRPVRAHGQPRLRRAQRRAAGAVGTRRASRATC